MGASRACRSRRYSLTPFLPLTTLSSPGTSAQHSTAHRVVTLSRQMLEKTTRYGTATHRRSSYKKAHQAERCVHRRPESTKGQKRHINCDDPVLTGVLLEAGDGYTAQPLCFASLIRSCDRGWKQLCRSGVSGAGLRHRQRRMQPNVKQKRAGTHASPFSILESPTA